MDDQTLADRRPVWLALSELFLDTELDQGDFERLVGKLKKSPYSPDQLEKILFHEVYPVLWSNLFAVAGVWSGFDEDWLVESIQIKCRKRFKWPFTRRWFGSMIKGDWQAVKRLLPVG